MPKKKPTGTCFPDANNFVMREDNEAHVVHCCVSSMLDRSKRHVHAWNEMKDPEDGWVVYDKSAGEAFMSRGLYYQLGNIRGRTCKRYKGLKEVAPLLAHHKHHGPWDLPDVCEPDPGWKPEDDQ